MKRSHASSVDTILESYQGASRDALIPVLQEVQEHEGYLSEAVIIKISRQLNLPASKIYGVASFYNQFRFQPKGKFHITVCRGTACHVKGSAKVLDMIMKTLKIGPGQTTRDKMFSLEVVACMGACGLSPVININGEIYAKTTPMKAVRILNELREKELVHV